MVMKGTNFTLENFGPMESWKDLTMVHPVRGQISGKNFLRSTLGLTGMEFSLNSIECPIASKVYQDNCVKVYRPQSLKSLYIT